MNLPDKLVLAVLNLGLSPKETLEKLHSYDNIRRTVIDRQAKIKKIEEEADKAIKALNAEQICNHDFTHVLRDMFHGADNRTECLVCGQIVYEREQRRS
jgi:hypothetical protein